MTVTGEPGIGKSAFISKLRADLEVGEEGGMTARHPLILAGSPDSPASHVQAYSPLTRALSAADARLEPRRGWHEDVLQAMRQELPSWFELVPGAGPVIGRALSLSNRLAESRGPQPLDVGDPRRRELMEWIDGRLHSGSPIVLLLDDMQWADQSTIEFVASLASREAPGAIVLVLGFRSGELGERDDRPFSRLLPALLEKATVTEITLKHLSREAAYKAISDLGGPRRDGFTKDSLYRRSRGNPYFLGILVRSSGEASDITFNSADTLPYDLSRYLDGWIDSLTAVERTVLEVASVVGPEFTAADIAALAEMPVAEVDAGIHALFARQIFLDNVKLLSGGWGYAIHHPVLGDRLRARLAIDRARLYRLHRNAAQFRMPAAEAGDLSAISSAARHLRESDADEACVWCLHAAKANQMAGTLSESAIFARWAMELGAKGEAAVESHYLLGQLRLQLRRFEDATRTLARAEPLAVQNRVEGPILVQVRLELARALRTQNEWKAAEAALNRAHATKDQVELRASLDATRGEIALCGDAVDTRLASRSLHAALKSRDPRRRTSVCGYLALTAFANQDVDSANKHLALARTEAKKSGSPAARYEAAMFTAQISLGLCAFRDAEAAVLEMDEMSRQAGIDATENYRCRARLHALQAEHFESAIAYGQFLMHEQRRCEAMSWRPEGASKDRVSSGAAHIEEQSDELVQLHGFPVAQAFLGTISKVLEFEKLSRVFPDLRARIAALSEGVRDREMSVEALSSRGVRRSDAKAARWAFSFYMHDLAGFRRSSLNAADPTAESAAVRPLLPFPSSDGPSN